MFNICFVIQYLGSFLVLHYLDEEERDDDGPIGSVQQKQYV